MNLPSIGDTRDYPKRLRLRLVVIVVDFSIRKRTDAARAAALTDHEWRLKVHGRTHGTPKRLVGRATAHTGTWHTAHGELQEHTDCHLSKYRSTNTNPCACNRRNKAVAPCALRAPSTKPGARAVSRDPEQRPGPIPHAFTAAPLCAYLGRFQERSQGLEVRLGSRCGRC